MVDEAILEKYRKAGKVAAEAANYARTLVKPGLPVLDLGTKIEKFILDEGVGLSFPVNLSIDDVAAHYSPPIDDTLVLPEKGLLKIDLGTHADGYIADHAITVDIGKTGGVYQDLIKAAEAGLQVVVENFRAGQNVVHIGKLVEDAIVKRGFLPIRNLGGHNLEQFNLHGGVFVPNTGSGYPYVLKEGDVFAVEPFSTNGAGHVVDGTSKFIYRFNKRSKHQLPMPLASYLEMIRRQCSTLPFSPRWLEGKIPKERIMPSIIELARKDLLQAYPLLMERAGGLVAQAEHTVIVHKDSAEITTVS
ncbi:MAG: type II methionyl aminopeptidase [Candidatus Lokiarchaeota archaeon]|nr:type II methionyl aminopeptidase [Candidatus Lokiarchaeota archaeon]